MEIKIAFVVVLISVANLFGANTYSQSVKVTLDMEDKTLEQVMDEIEKQSEFYFVFNQKQINVNRVVNVQAENKLITEVLPELFSGTNVNYAVLDRKILLTTDPLEKEMLTMVSETRLQQNQITGTVTDEKGNPLPGVTVIVKGTAIGSISDASGKYTISNPPQDATIVFSFVGMATQEIPSEGRTRLDVVMKEEAIGLDEVVVVGYGTQKKANLTGSVSSVTSDKLENRQATSSSLALAGELSGISIRQLAGNPRAEAETIRIRGMGTFSSAGTQPLVLIDGIPGSINGVDPNNIKSVSVLKDAASASIYGSQAANGVILIETKRGEAGKIKFNFYSYIAKQQATDLPEYAPSWMFAEGWNEALKNQGQSPRYTEEEILKYKSGTDPNYPNYDHIKQVFTSGKGFKMKNGLSVSGGNDATQYFFSTSYLNDEAILRNNYGKDYNVQFNLNTKLRNNVRFSTNISSNLSEGRQPGQGSTTTGSGIARITRGATRLNNTIIGVRDDGYFGHMETVHYADLYSPSFFSDSELYLYGNGSLAWDIIKGLTLSGKLGYTNSEYKSKSFRADYVVSPALRITPSLLDENWSQNNALTAQSLITYNKTIVDHNIGLLGGFEQIEYISSSLRAQRDNFPANEVTEIDAGSIANDVNGGNSSRRKLRSYFGRLNYDYKGKYLFEANLRYDGSSRFPQERRWALFPSFSGGWRISKEDFLQDILPWIYDLKIRGSWGELGNQSVGNYPYQSIISLTPEAAIGSSVVGGAAVTTIPNKNITWETTRVTDMGMDLTVWDGKLTLTADYYYKLTYDILYTLSRSYMLGANASPANAGKVENKGWDFELSHNNSYGDFSYSVIGNFAINHNKVIDLEGVTVDIGQGLFVGHTIGSGYGYVADGLYVDEADVQNYATQTVFKAEPGLIKFKDISGPEGVPDGKVDATYDRTVIGQPLPITTYGLSFNANYKRLFLSFLFQGEGGRKSNMSGRSGKESEIMWNFLAFCNLGNLQKWIYESRWTTENPDPNAKYPKLLIGGRDLANNTTSSFWIRNATFLRLKNLRFGYNLPNSTISKIGINNIGIYVNGENLFTIHNFFPHWDPEMLTENISQGWYPLLRTFSFGINVDF